MSQSELREHTYNGAKRWKMKVTHAFAWLVEQRACLLWLVEARTIHSETFTEQLDKSLCSCVAFSKTKTCAKTEVLKGKKNNIFKPFENSRFFFVSKSLRGFISVLSSSVRLFAFVMRSFLIKFVIQIFSNWTYVTPKLSVWINKTP